MSPRKPSVVIALAAVLLGLGSCPVAARVLYSPALQNRISPGAQGLLRLAICGAVIALAYIVLSTLNGTGPLDAASAVGLEPLAPIADDRRAFPRSGARTIFASIVIAFATIGAVLAGFLMEYGAPKSSGHAAAWFFSGAWQGALIGGAAGLAVGLPAAAVVFIVKRLPAKRR